MKKVDVEPLDLKPLGNHPF